MRISTRLGAVLAAVVLLAGRANAEETQLFNGRDLDGWTFHTLGDDEQQVDDPWVVHRGMLVCRGMATGYLIHQSDFENYVLTLEVRTMSTDEGGGMAVGSLGSVFVNATPEAAEFGHSPKAIEISMREPGEVFFRDVDRDTFFHHNEKWVFRAPDFADDIDRDMGEWNLLKVICNGAKMTIVMNGTVVNQVEPINRTKGAVALKSDRGFVAAPTFYRNIAVRPVGPADLADEQRATAEFAKVKVEIAKRQAAEEASRLAEEQRRVAEEQMQAEQQKQLAKQWTEVGVDADIPFTPDVRQLPFPKDAQEIEFSAVFDTVEFESRQSLAAITKFYSTEMARRGWRVTDTDIEDDEATITFKQGEAEVELELDESSNYVDVSMDCEELSFDGVDDPAGLVKLGVPQPKAYLVLQGEFALPDNYQDQEYDMGNRRLFKSTLSLEELYAFLTQQLRSKGYRETRRPIITSDRRYSKFAKNGVELGVNCFEHEIGSRVVLTVE